MKVQATGEKPGSVGKEGPAEPSHRTPDRGPAGQGTSASSPQSLSCPHACHEDPSRQRGLLSGGAGEPQGLWTDSRCPRTWTKETFPSLSSVSSDRSSTSLRPWAEPTRAQGTVTAVAVTRRHQEAVISHQGGTRRRHTRPALLRGHRRWSARRGSWTCSQEAGVRLFHKLTSNILS